MTDSHTAEECLAFERWLQDVQHLSSVWQEERNCYADFPAHLAFSAWRASRAEPPTDAVWAQALDIIGQLVEIDVPENDEFATGWIREGNGFFDKHAVAFSQESLKARRAPPPVKETKAAGCRVAADFESWSTPEMRRLAASQWNRLRNQFDSIQAKDQRIADLQHDVDVYRGMATGYSGRITEQDMRIAELGEELQRVQALHADFVFRIKRGGTPPPAAPQALDEAGKLADWINAARPVITALMSAYERRIRTECTAETLPKEPWRCSEYIQAERLLAEQPVAVVEVTVETPAPHETRQVVSQSDCNEIAAILQLQRPDDAPTLQTGENDGMVDAVGLCDVVDGPRDRHLVGRSLPAPAYIFSEPHLSGYRLVLGYETMAEVHAAHATVAKPVSP